MCFSHLAANHVVSVTAASPRTPPQDLMGATIIKLGRASYS